MWFNSFGFWIFFAAVAIGCRRFGHRGQNRFLLVASWYFYACWDWRFLSLIGLTTVVDYWAGRGVSSATTRRGKQSWVGLSLVVNLSVLGFFKYFGFFVAEFGRLLAWLGFEGGHPVWEIVLPAGISFYTFQALSYTIDVYRGQTRPASSFFDFALYLSFFPQLVAGPIERSSQLLPQVELPRPRLDEARFREGLCLVLTGLFRKVVVADNMAWLANGVFSRDPAELEASEVLVGVWAFAFQIYGDFSGYSAIAIGVAKWLGFDLMENFRQPYFALNPRDFWSRWHISLSTWLRDYVYIPLGGNRRGRGRTAVNLMATMLLGGFWHGASWTFVWWGALHGGWLVVHRLLCGDRSAPERGGGGWVGGCGRLVRWLITFHLVCLGWLFFRSQSIGQAWALLERLGTPWRMTDFTSTSLALQALVVGPFLLYEGWIEKRKDALALCRVAWPVRAAAYLYLLAMLVFFAPPAATEFLYFQF